MSDDRQFAPATLRNRDFILDVLLDVLPATGDILEVASGSGEHIVHFARNFPAVIFQTSDPEPDALLSIAAWVRATRVTNVRKPILLDASQSVWPSSPRQTDRRRAALRDDLAWPKKAKDRGAATKCGAELSLENLGSIAT
jgi:hypothetical protein